MFIYKHLTDKTVNKIYNWDNLHELIYINHSFWRDSSIYYLKIHVLLQRLKWKKDGDIKNLTPLL